jgi:hypothetical protein
MTLGFDFDKVFIDYPPFIPYTLVDYLYKGSLVFRKNRTKNVVLHYRFPGPFEQKIRVLSHYPLFRHVIKPNVASLKRIAAKKKYKTYLVSSRFGFLKDRTQLLMEKHKFKDYFDGVYFNFENKQPHLFKEETIRNLKIDTYIDDDLDLVLYLSKKIPDLKIYWLKDGRKKNDQLPKNITAISSLKELEKFIGHGK